MPKSTRTHQILKDWYYHEPLRYAFKTALAGTLSAFVAFYFEMAQGYWAVIAALFVMQSDMDRGTWEATLRAGFDRLLGTVIGVSLGFLGHFLMLEAVAFNQSWALQFILFLTLMACAMIHRYFIDLKMVPITAALIMFLGLTSPNPTTLAIARIYEILLGVVVAVLVNVIVWPQSHHDYSKAKFEELLNMSREMIIYLIEERLQGRYVTREDAFLKERIRAYRSLLQDNRQILLHLPRYLPDYFPWRYRWEKALANQLHTLEVLVRGIEESCDFAARIVSTQQREHKLMHHDGQDAWWSASTEGLRAWLKPLKLLNQPLQLKIFAPKFMHTWLRRHQQYIMHKHAKFVAQAMLEQTMQDKQGTDEQSASDLIALDQAWIQKLARVEGTFVDLT